MIGSYHIAGYVPLATYQSLTIRGYVYCCATASYCVVHIKAVKSKIPISLLYGSCVRYSADSLFALGLTPPTTICLLPTTFASMANS